MKFYPLISHKFVAIQRISAQRPKLALLSAFLVPFLLLTTFGFALRAGATDEPREMELSGIVTTAPSQADGRGEWHITTYHHVVYTMFADAQTRFKNGVPQVRQQVKIKGFLTAERTIKAKEVERRSDGDNGDVELRGLLLAVPDQTDGIGAWIIQSQTAVTYTVLVNVDTRLDDGVPDPGMWLNVRGQWQYDGNLLASRIRSDDHEGSQVIVRLADGVLSTTVASQYGLVPLRTLLASANIHLFRTNEDEERSLVNQLNANSAKVVWAELNYVGGIPEGHGYKTWHWGGDDSSGYINQNAFAQVNLSEHLQADGTGLIIAVLDTGIDQAHPAFANRLLAGWDMVNDDSNPDDEGDGLGWGHGTHVSGILAKVAPKSMILPIRVLDSNGRGNLFTLAYAIEWAVNHGADVINLSLGAEADARVLRDTIEQALAQGVIIVAAAGNSNINDPQFPASYAGVISVTAVDDANVKADFANYGKFWVDLAAPGVGITSTMVGPQGSGYASWSGTSMSAPFVSGAAALVRQTMPTATAAQIAAQLQSHSQSIDQQNPTYIDQLGGLLDIKAAVGEAASGPATTLYLPLIKKKR